MDPREMGGGGDACGLVYLAQDRDQWLAVVNSATNFMYHKMIIS
jgi:hypothetical protein